MVAMAVALAMLAGGCRSLADGDAATGLPWSRSTQLVLVTTADWDASRGTLQAFERDGDQWRAASAPAPVVIGRAGSAWGSGLHPAQGGPAKREGDGRAPAGVFPIGSAFGYASGVSTALPYRAMRASDYCIDVSQSPLYNRIVDSDQVGAAAVAGSTEPMRRDLHANGDQRYKLGFVIGHNAAGAADAGSCIFAHLWKAADEATAGCTAMDEATMRSLLGWLRPQHQPVFVLLPKPEYQRLRSGWALPSPTPR
ncbi:hypothetical protein EER27_06450 [Lysobacter psychrotolerans]|uniref:YkuD domain-containing protein n=2 Tax=Montanilutibacter psychrotolerans TaxID=1327343 RepID=A0A3M8SX61_9GAMM|nr:hypothetical protein EER27_06450 [Lysobacter psychrotolerans]